MEEIKFVYEELFGKIEDGIILAKNYEIIFVNKALCKMFGVDGIDDFKGTSAADFSPELQPNGKSSLEMLHTYMNASHKESVSNIPWVFQRKDGSIFDAEASITFTKKGKNEYLQTIVRDISKHVKYEKRLKKSEEKLKKSLEFTNQLINTIPNPVFYKDMKGLYIDCSKAFEEYLGRTREEIVGHSVFDIAPKEVANVYHKADKELFESGGRQIYESVIYKKDGSLRNVVFNKSVFYNSEGQKAGIVGVIYDITDIREAEIIAKENQEKYVRLFTESNDAILIFKNRELIDSNKNAQMLFNASTEELNSIENFWPEYQFDGKSSKRKFNEMCRKVERGESMVVEWQFHNNDGSQFISNVSASGYLQGHNHYIQLFIRNITETYRVSEELKEKERSIRTLLNNLPGMAYRVSVDHEWTIEFVSFGSENVVGYAPDDLLSGRITSQDIIFPEDYEMVKSEMIKSIKEKSGFQIVYRIITPKKCIKWVWEKGECIFNDFGDPIAIEGFITDITERVNAENLIRESRENYKNLVENFPDGIAISVNQNIVYFNQTCLKLLGINYQDIITEKDFLKHIDNLKRKKIQKQINDARLGKENNFEEVVFNRFDNKKEINIELKALHYLYNNEDAVQIITRDISTQKELETQKIHSKIMEESNIVLQKEILERKITEEKLNNSLYEKEILLKEVHHRVKNNLQIISSILNLQTSFIDSPEVIEMVHESQNRIKSMALVHENLYKNKDISKIDFKEYVKNLVGNLYRSYGIDSTKISLSLDIEQVYLSLDIGIPCGLILNELITNSIKYAFKGIEKGKIFVHLQTISSNKYSLIIADNGIGMKKNINIHNTNTLGLQLVITLVEQIEGEIKVESKNGTKFTITFSNYENK